MYHTDVQFHDFFQTIHTCTNAVCGATEYLCGCIFNTVLYSNYVGEPVGSNRSNSSDALILLCSTSLHLQNRTADDLKI